MRRLHIADSCRDHKNRVDFYSRIATFRHTMTFKGSLCGFFCAGNRLQADAVPATFLLFTDSR